MNIEMEKRAMEYLKAFQPKTEPYYLCYSGGKDSDTILHLAKLADVNYEAVHNLTTVDAPETVRYVKSQPDVRIDRPEISMWRLIEKKRIPPTMRVRYCCEYLKERGGKGRVKITGVRWAESVRRKLNAGLVKIVGKEQTMKEKAEEEGLSSRSTRQGGLILNDDNAETRRFVEMCYRTTSTMVNPIVDWSDEDVWEFLHHYGIRSNPLYEVTEYNGTFKPCNQHRVGCIGCPMASKQNREKDLIRYPIYRDNYLRAFDRMLRKKVQDGLPLLYKDAYDLMVWWLMDDPNQMSLFGEPEYLKGAVKLEPINVEQIMEENK